MADGHEGTLELRRLTPDDWELWREVRLRALAEAPHAFGSTLSFWQGDGDVVERWRARLTDVPLNVVALLDERPVGQVGGTGPDPSGRCELISMWVDPEARGAGVGDALIQQVVEWAASVYGTALMLAVREQNAHAVALYVRAGFAVSDEAADGPSEIRMQRPLH